MIYRRKNNKRKNNDEKLTSKASFQHQNTTKQTKNPKQQRLAQVEAEIQELAHKSDYQSQEQMDKLMLERWQLRYQLGL